MPAQLFHLSKAQQREIGNLVADFEAAWVEGRNPEIATHLPTVGGDIRSAALLELVRLDVEYRQRAGQQPLIDEYLADFPELALDVRALDSLAEFAAGPDPPRVELEVISGPHQGTRFEFESHESLLAGRASIARLQLSKDRHFSRHHFRLEVSPPRIHLIDLDSRNGTFVNGNRVRQTALAPGDIISGGRTKIRVSVKGAAAEAAYNAPTVIGAETHEEDVATVDYTALPESRTAPAAPVQQVPGYELQCELGHGSMGIVYRARQKSSGKILAVKLMKPNAAPSFDSLRLFVREASILSKLKHRHIIRFYEMGTAAGGEFFVATEFVDVVALETLLAEKPVPFRVKVICGIACHVLDALKYAHETGLVHRDIKPSNILLSRETGKLNAKLGDFGLAKNYADAGFSDLTNDGDLRGSPSYLCPEQIVNARYATPACDIYSLGVTLYQMFSGRLPYEVPRGSSVLRAILESPPVPLRERCPELPGNVLSLVHKAIEKDPNARFRSAAEMYDACYPLRRGEMELQTPIPE
jgi:serine/threonine-protein kinase